MATSDITNLIERFEELEERVGIRLEGLLAVLQNGFFNRITINGELHPLKGKELSHNIELVVTAHDFSGRVQVTRSVYFYKKIFYGFEVFSINLQPSISFSKICILPKILDKHSG